MTTILAIDPGTRESGVVLFDGLMVLDCAIEPNAEVLERLRHYPNSTIAIERFEARGMPMADDSIETVLWTGRFIQASQYPASVLLIRRREIKLALCGSARAKDPNVRQALIDRLGAPGTKKAPGPTYGVTSHGWAALAVAVVAADWMQAGGMPTAGPNTHGRCP